jgi:hypothetical protein
MFQQNISVYQIIQCHIPEDHSLNTKCQRSLKYAMNQQSVRCSHFVVLLYMSKSDKNLKNVLLVDLVHTGSILLFHQHSPGSSTHTQYMLLTQVKGLLCMQLHTTVSIFFCIF